MKTILYLTTVLPQPPRTGGEVASCTFIRALRDLGNRVIVVGYERPDWVRSDADDLVSIGIRPIESTNAKLQTALWLLSSMIQGHPFSVEKYVSRDYLSVINELLRSNAVDLIIVDHTQMGWLLDKFRFTQPVVLITHNIEKDIYFQQAEHAENIFKKMLYNRESRLIGEMERKWPSLTNEIWCLTKSDTTSYHRFVSNHDSVFTMGVPSLYLPPTCKKMTECDVVMLGTWSWGPNRIGLEWFIAKVLPRLPAALQIRIGGRGAEHLLGLVPDNVKIVGPVASVEEFLGVGRVVAIPSISGSGIQIKTLDALAIANCVVTTSVGVRGIESLPESVIVVDDPVEFAAALIFAIDKGVDSQSEIARDRWVGERKTKFSTLLKERLSVLLE